MTLGRLTTREREVFSLVAQGMASKEIAESLGLRLATVASHRRSICRKLSIHSAAELVYQAVTVMTRELTCP